MKRGEAKKKVIGGLGSTGPGDSCKFIPSNDDLCRMLAKVIMKTSGLDAAAALERAGQRLRARLRRRQAEREDRDHLASRLWMKLAGKPT